MLDPRLDRAALPMALGDLAVLAVIFGWGTVTHHGPGVLTTRPLYVAATVAPFLVGWAIAGPLLGAYAPGVSGAPGVAVGRALRAWVLADAIALALRATPLVHGGVASTFVLVTLVTGALGLAVWRSVYGRWADTL